jgi:endonuclease I
MSHGLAANRIGRHGAALYAVAISVTIGWAATSLADPPPGYYDTADTSSPAALRASLHDIIDDHTRYPYTSTATDTWDILELADEDPNNINNILDVYLNASIEKFGGGVGPYEREHTWPKSYGFPNDNSQNYPYTDCHHLFLCDPSYNSSRSNKPFRYCDAACSEKPTLYNNGQGGGSGVYPGNSNWTSGQYTAGTWETWIGRRGDVARAQLYMDVRYEGGTHGVTGAAEPDLILTDNEALIDACNTGSNESVAYMGMLSVLLQWHLEDPVDDVERWRNDVVYSFQDNRNPFIDHPEWVDCVFNGNCGCTTPADCDDGLFCNGAEDCVDGSCVAGTDPCPGQLCDEAGDVCIPLDCDNDGVCESGEDCNNCPADCISGTGGAACGNGVCEAGDGEDCVSCPADCNGIQTGKPSGRFCCGATEGCGDSRCTTGGWMCTTEPQGTSYCCGDFVCEGAEDGYNCEIDCGAQPYCGDGTCDPDEDQCNCPDDCGFPPATEIDCTDGLDEDCDGAADCDDPTGDCDADPACACLPRGAACTLDGECCSNWCHRGACK